MMAQLDDQAAVVADDSTDSAAAILNNAADTQEAPEADPVGDMYPDDQRGEDDAGDLSDGDGDAAPDDDAGASDLADDLPPIAAPTSWKAEEKEAFSQLPRTVQETITRREAEREKFVNSKAQEATQAKQAIEREAYTVVQQIEQRQMAALSALLPQIPDEPSHMLQVDDPYAYAEQMEARRHAIAQHQQVQHLLQGSEQRLTQAQQQQAALEAQQTAAVLQDKLPEFFDESEGPKLRETLGSIALDFFGYPPEELPNANANEILGMKKVIDLQEENRVLREKAEKWDSFQKSKMESVRAARGKQIPNLARPGSAGGGQPQNVPVEKLLYPND